MAEGVYQELVDLVSKMRPSAGLVDAFVLVWGDYSVDRRVRWDKRGAAALRNDLALTVAASVLATLEKEFGNRQEALQIFIGELYKKMPSARRIVEEATDEGIGF